MVFDDNDGGVDDNMALLHATSLGVYANEKETLIKGWCLVEVVGSYGKNFLWGVLVNHIVEEVNDHDEIGLQGFDFNLFDEDEKGVDREGMSEYTYSLMLTKMWLGDWKNHL